MRCGLTTTQTFLSRSYAEELKPASVFAIVLLLISLIIDSASFKGHLATLPYLLSQFLLFTALLFLGRCLVTLVTKRMFIKRSHIILLTNFTDDRRAVKQLEQNGYRVLVYFSHQNPMSTFLEVPVLHDFEQVRYLLSHNEVQEVFVTSDAFSDFICQRAFFFSTLGIPVSLIFDEKGEGDAMPSLIFHKIGTIETLTSSLNHIHYRSLLFKRLCDIVFSLIGLVLTGLVAIIIYPIVRMQSKGPLIFKQKRVGKNGKVFEIFKFRSMYLDAEERKKELMAQNELTSDLMFKMDNDPRIFPFGQKMRNWSLDELPQFINVLKGDMSSSAHVRQP